MATHVQTETRTPMREWLGLGLAAILLASCAPVPAQPPLLVDVVASEEGCAIVWNGRRVDTSTAEQLLSLIEKGSEIRVRNANSLPPPCQGGTFYTMQRKGYAKVGWLAPPPAETAREHQ